MSESNRRQFLFTTATLWVASCVADDDPEAPGSDAAGDDGADDHGDEHGGSDGGSDGGSGGGSVLETYDCDPIATTFPTIVDNEGRATFSRMDESTLADWFTIGTATSALMAPHVPVAITNLLLRLETLTLGYPIDLLTHSLQCATRARQAGASDELVLAALCHKVGVAISPEGYSEISAAAMRGHVSEATYRVVRHFEEFAWMHYGTHMGQPTDLRNRYTTELWYGDAVRFCDEWVMPSFDPEFEAMPLEAFEGLLGSRFGDGALVSEATAEDCIR